MLKKLTPVSAWHWASEKEKKKKSLMSPSTTPFLCCFPPLPKASSVVSVIKRSVPQTDIHFSALCSKPICKLQTCWIQPCSRRFDRASYWKYTSVHSKTWRHPTFLQQGGISINESLSLLSKCSRSKKLINTAKWKTNKQTAMEFYSFPKTKYFHNPI